MKKTGLLVMAVVMCLVVLAACAKPAPAPAPSPIETKTPVSTTSSTSINLRINDWGPSRAFTKSWEWWAAEVEQRTEKAVTFSIFFNEALGASEDQIDNIKAGVFDMGVANPAYAPGKTPLHTVVTIPMLTGDMTAMEKALAEIEALSAMKAELTAWNAKFLFAVGSPSYQYVGKKPVYEAGDFKGLRIRTAGEFAKLADELGAVVVPMAAPEVYEAVLRNTIDGVWFTLSAIDSYKLYEVAEYVSIAGLGSLAFPFVISMDTWNSLDSKTQTIMLEVAHQVPDKSNEFTTQSESASIEKIKAAGVEVSELSAAERAKLQTLADPLWAFWVSDMNKRGLPGQEILDAFLNEISKYEKQ